MVKKNNNFLNTKYMSNIFELPLREVAPNRDLPLSEVAPNRDLPSDLWAIILTYTNDITSCNNLYTSLPDYTQRSISKTYHKHILSLSVNILFANVNKVSIYKNNTLSKNIIKTERVIDMVRFRPSSNEFCVAETHGLITFWDRHTIEKVRTLQLTEYYINQLEFHPDGTKMVTISGPQIKLWSIENNVSIQNSVNFIYPIQSLCFHPTLPFVYLARIFNNKLIGVHRWNYQLSTMDILPLHSPDFLLESVYTEPIMYPIHFSMNRNSIDGVCCGHIKTISLDNQQPTVVNRTDQNHISDFLWNKDRTILYYIYYDSINHLSCIRIYNGDIIYTSTFTVSKLLGLIQNESQLIMIEEGNAIRLDLTTLQITPLFELVSTSMDTDFA
jgi:WD40 repeat protein